MRRHTVHPARPASPPREHDGAEQPGAQVARLIPVAGLAVRRQPAEKPDRPVIRRTLVDNSGGAPVAVTTEAQLQNYPWWNSLTGPQQDHILGYLDPDLPQHDLHQLLATVPRRAVTGGMDLVNQESWVLIRQLVDRYDDVVCADPALDVQFTNQLKQKNDLSFSNVRQVIQQAAPGARNADIFIIHPGPWIYQANTLHLDLQAVMTPGCVAYVLTDNEGSSGQANTLVQGLAQLGGFTVTVQEVARDQQGMVDLAPTPHGALRVKPYHTGGYRLIRIAA